MSESTPRSESHQESGETGWLVLAERRSVAKILDALLDLPPHREFNQTELADFAGISRQSVNTHLDLLLEIGVVEPVPGTRPQRFTFAPESEVSQAIIELDGAMNAVGPYA